MLICSLSQVTSFIVKILFFRINRSLHSRYIFANTINIRWALHSSRVNHSFLLSCLINYFSKSFVKKILIKKSENKEFFENN
jgi:hypothetical protein